MSIQQSQLQVCLYSQSNQNLLHAPEAKWFQSLHFRTIPWSQITVIACKHNIIDWVWKRAPLCLEQSAVPFELWLHGKWTIFSALPWGNLQAAYRNRVCHNGESFCRKACHNPIICHRSACYNPKICLRTEVCHNCAGAYVNSPRKVTSPVPTCLQRVTQIFFSSFRNNPQVKIATFRKESGNLILIFVPHLHSPDNRIINPQTTCQFLVSWDSNWGMLHWWSCWIQSESHSAWSTG